MWCERVHVYVVLFIIIRAFVHTAPAILELLGTYSNIITRAVKFVKTKTALGGGGHITRAV